MAAQTCIKGVRKIKAQDELDLAKVSPGQLKGLFNLYLEREKEQGRCRYDVWG